jgi:hypothetical protein
MLYQEKSGNPVLRISCGFEEEWRENGWNQKDPFSLIRIWNIIVPGFTPPRMYVQALYIVHTCINLSMLATHLFLTCYDNKVRTNGCMYVHRYIYIQNAYVISFCCKGNYIRINCILLKLNISIICSTRSAKVFLVVAAFVIKKTFCNPAIQETNFFIGRMWR